ncbi:MAG: hypothetical protein RLZZ618_2494 [Pseudomonadota bacterium]|jgi:hypothetical protein
MNPSHNARYLVLLGPTDAPRALLFSGEHRYLAEMIDDDGMMVDTLLKSSRVCPRPRNLKFDAVATVDPAHAAKDVRCYALG